MLQPDTLPDQTLRIVVADSARVDREMVSRLLRVDRTCVVEEAANEDALMALLARGDVSCVLIERSLGEESAFAINDRIRESYPRLPVVIMLASAGREEIAVKAFRCGFSDYLKKQSLTARNLSDAVLRAVGRRRAEVLQEAELEYLAKLARLDRLTGLPNREFLEERLSVLGEGGRRHQSPFALLVIDINEFDKINKTFGHVTGDAALKAFAGRLKQVARASDVFGRLGADQFLYMIDWEVTAERTELACRRLAEALTFSIDLENVGLALSCSIGAAIYPRDGDSPATLLHAANQALEAAKAPGGGYSLAGAPPIAIVTPIPTAGARAMRATEATASGRPGTPRAGRDAPEGGQLSLMLAETMNGHAHLPGSMTPASLGAEGIHREGNRRAERRNRVLKRGVLITNDGFSTIDCIIRDISTQGAHITVQDEYVADPSCSLLVVESGKKFTAETRWQNGRDIGVRFLD